jgi:hypothetical protein
VTFTAHRHAPDQILAAFDLRVGSRFRPGRDDGFQGEQSQRQKEQCEKQFGFHARFSSDSPKPEQAENIRVYRAAI